MGICITDTEPLYEISRKNGYVNMKDKERNITTVSEENIYLLNGRVPLGKAIPFGLQHVLAMFVANLAPVLIVCSATLVRGCGRYLQRKCCCRCVRSITAAQSDSAEK